MGQRTIDTVLRVSSESAYKTALRNCTAELKVMKSELDKTTSDFRTNANSMEALTQKGEVLNKMYAAQKEKISLLHGALEKAQNKRDEEQQTVEQLRQEYAQAKDALDAYGETVDKTSQEYQEQKAKVDSLRDSVITHQKQLDSSAKSVSYYATQLNKAEVELNDLSDKQARNNQLLDEAKRSADGCATSIDKYGDTVREAADGTEASASAVEALAGAMVASGIQQKVEDLAAGMMECSEAAQNYEKTIAQVATIADTQVMTQQALHSGILELSTDLRKDAEEVSDAAYNALSAGIKTNQVLNFTKQSSQLATAGFTDMGTSVDVLTTILNAYRLEAEQTEKVASVLVKTQDLGKITVDELGKVVGRVIPSAAAYGVNLNNVATAYANMTAAGINAENTTTYLSTMMDELADSGSNVAKVLKNQTGKTFAELMADGKSLGDVLEIIGASVKYDNTQFSNLWSSATAGKAAIALFNGSAADFNRTLDQMANSSGTVAKNYETMTAISEYSSQRVAVASKNLSIAVGTQLNPVLDKLRNAGAGIMETAAEAVNSNPVLASSVAGTVTALGMLATGLSGLMVAKSVTAAMQALNITLAANPAFLIATGVVALGAALATFVAHTQSATSEVEALTEASRALSNTISEGNASYEDTVISAGAAHDTVGRYIDRLAELEQQNELTAAQEQEYAMLLERITALMPELNLQLDAETGLLQNGANALRDQADAWKENAIQKAAYARYQEDAEALGKAEYELAKNEAKLSLARKDATAITEHLEQVTEDLYDAQTRQNRLNADLAAGLEVDADELYAVSQQVASLSAEYEQLCAQQEANAQEQKNLTEAVTQGEQSIASVRTEVDAAKMAYDELAKSAEDSSTNVQTAAADLADSAGQSLEELQQQYDDLKASARESLDKQIGLFDELEDKCDMSTEEMIRNLKKQQTAFQNYAKNIETAVARGIDTGLVQKLSDGSEESMLILAELVTATDEQIAELNEAFRGTSESKDAVAQTVADIADIFGSTMDGVIDDAYDAGYEMGANTADGAITAVKNKAKSYSNAVASLARAGFDAYKTTNMIKSPSKRYEWLAQQDVAGLTTTYQKSVPKMQEASRKLADSGYLASIRTRQAAIPSISRTVSQASAPANDGNTPMLQKILAAIKAGQVLLLDGKTWVGGTANSYDEALGQNKILADRGAQ